MTDDERAEVAKLELDIAHHDSLAKEARKRRRAILNRVRQRKGPAVQAPRPVL